LAQPDGRVAALGEQRLRGVEDLVARGLLGGDGGVGCWHRTDRSVGATIPDGRWSCQAGRSTTGASRGRRAGVSEGHLRGRVCVVTGASSGIGRATAHALGRLGATLGLVCRDRARGEALVTEVRAASRHDGVTLFVADLSSQEAVRGVADALRAAYPALQVLVNNAGVVNLRYAETADGIETVFAVNHLAPFLLTHLLLGRLAAGGPARIVNVASDVHRWGRIDFDDLGRRRRYRGMAVYAQSKLANVLFTYELARRLAGTAVTANCLHPGAVATGLGHNNGRLARGVARDQRNTLARGPRRARHARPATADATADGRQPVEAGERGPEGRVPPPLDPQRLAAAVGPVELVGLRPAQEVELAHAAPDQVLDHHPEQHFPGRIVAGRGVEAGLVRVVRAAVDEAVAPRDGPAVLVQEGQVEPASLRCALGEALMEGQVIGLAEVAPAAGGLHASLVQRRERGERVPHALAGVPMLQRGPEAPPLLAMVAPEVIRQPLLE